LLQVTKIPAADDVVAADEGLLLPVPGTGKNELRLEPRDGRQVVTVEVSGVRIESGSTNVLLLPDVSARALITDARLTFACSSYDTGGGWRGDPTSMLIFNAVSKTRAYARSRGTMLVGQVRYPWVARVGSTAKAGRGSQERLCIDTEEAPGTPWRMTLALGDTVDAAGLAAEIARRAAAYRLSCEELDPEERRSLERLADVGPIPASAARAKNEAAFHEFPTFWKVSDVSARIAPSTPHPGDP
jgi:hypothetical protein